MSEPPWLERGERSQQRRQLAAPGDRRASLNRTRGSLFRFRAEAAETEAVTAGHPLEFVSKKNPVARYLSGLPGAVRWAAVPQRSPQQLIASAARSPRPSSAPPWPAR